MSLTDSNNGNTEKWAQARKLLLDFYSSEINSHSRLIIGFAALLFTFLQVYQKIEVPSFLQTIVFCIFVLPLALALWYSFFRLLAYGMMANAVVHVPDSVLEQKIKKKKNKGRPPSSILADAVVDQIAGKVRKGEQEKILFKIPAQYFIRSESQKWGRLISFLLALGTIGLLYLMLVRLA